ncbi:MAG: hypothetical protein A2Y33_02680 [Spirochaetes bacterium GWF1_51_8]|nr:MAG: hypothetical protein A2Y33_02680 [Spirochaetes bacterium GWF1_51_8]
MGGYQDMLRTAVKNLFGLFIVLTLAFCGQGIKPGSNSVMGFGILSRLPGLWSGPVFSDTPAGSFENWYVDFRPVSPGQIAQYSTLDADTVNYLTFFIVLHDGKLKVAMRTEGVFQNKGCVTYEVIEIADEEKGYYKFADFQAGDKRAYTEFKFSGDSFVMEVYTSKFGKVYPLELHSRWEAKPGDKKSAETAIKEFAFPQPVMVKDFTDVFKNMNESIYYTFESDPYPSKSQPYVGEVKVDIVIDKNLPLTPQNGLFLMLTTESLFNGIKYDKEKLKYTSRYIYLKGDIRTYTFKNVHPGKYFIYAYADLNNDRKYLQGDYMNSDIQKSFIVPPNGKAETAVTIDFMIP